MEQVWFSPFWAFASNSVKQDWRHTGRSWTIFLSDGLGHHLVVFLEWWGNMDDCLPALLLLGSPENANLCWAPDEQVGQIGSAKDPGIFFYSPSVALLAVGLTWADAMSQGGHGQDGDQSLGSGAGVGPGNGALTRTILCRSLSLCAG